MCDVETNCSHHVSSKLEEDSCFQGLNYSDLSCSAWRLSVGTIAFQSFITINIIVSNLVVIASLFRERFFNEVKYYFIASLAFADFLVGVDLAFYVIISVFGYGNAANLVCVAFFLILSVTQINSVLNLLLVTIDQYIAIVHPLHYYRIVTNDRARALLAFLWMVTVAWLVVAFFGLANIRTDIQSCSSVFIFQSWFISLQSIASFTAPSVIVTAMYGRVFVVARRHARVIYSQRTQQAWPENHEPGRRLPKVLKEAKTAIMITIVLGAFIISWLPYHVAVIVIISNRYLYNKIAVNLLGFIGVSNSFYNPYLYALRSQKMRRAFKKTLVCRNPPNEVTGISVTN